MRLKTNPLMGLMVLVSALVCLCLPASAGQCGCTTCYTSPCSCPGCEMTGTPPYCQNPPTSCPGAPSCTEGNCPTGMGTCTGCTACACGVGQCPGNNRNPPCSTSICKSLSWSCAVDGCKGSQCGSWCDTNACKGGPPPPRPCSPYWGGECQGGAPTCSGAACTCCPAVWCGPNCTEGCNNRPLCHTLPESTLCKCCVECQNGWLPGTPPSCGPAQPDGQCHCCSDGNSMCVCTLANG